jgi:hypothetical protein
MNRFAHEHIRVKENCSLKLLQKKSQSLFPAPEVEITAPRIKASNRRSKEVEEEERRPFRMQNQQRLIETRITN